MFSRYSAQAEEAERLRAENAALSAEMERLQNLPTIRAIVGAEDDLRAELEHCRAEVERLEQDVARMSQEQNALQSILDETLAENIALRRDADNAMPPDETEGNTVKAGFEIEPIKK